MCELLVGLPTVIVLGVVDERGSGPLRVHVELRDGLRVCSGCGAAARVKERPEVELVDLPVFGRRARLVWRKHRLVCVQLSCPVVSWTVENLAIASPRLAMTDRAGRWVTEQVGRWGRTVNEVAVELGCDWHTVNDAVIAYGTVLVDDPARIGEPTALGLDETLFAHQGPWRTQRWSTSIVDVGAGRLIDVVPGRSAGEPCKWLAARSDEWRARIAWATLDLSGPYRSVFDTMLPDATQIADPFHLIKLANSKLDECRRRVQNETMGHRGRKTDPLYRCRRLLTRADERLDDRGRTKLLGLLDAGDPRGEVRAAWHAKEVVRSIYEHHDPDLAVAFVERLGRDLQDESCPVEVQTLGRTLVRWKNQITAWHRAHVTNAGTEAANNLIKRVKRVAFGFTRWRNFRIRVLLYAGRPNWDLLATVTPC
ncbi:MAG TPA: ISL3 family transposase [Acidimicrobiales bacterium]|jgi:transposase|nr:ISL3 family transposase [Acidimicrobiales bacterium]